jgi:hypothetical protein
LQLRINLAIIDAAGTAGTPKKVVLKPTSLPLALKERSKPFQIPEPKLLLF